VNPVALKRVERLYCKNERAVIDLQLNHATASLTLVPVAAILVASIRLNFLDQTLNLKYKGPNRISCDASFNKGQEMGYFQHGSTIVVLASGDFDLCDNAKQGTVIRMGQPLLQFC
jgi:phosphatidylserine decarboxylase